MIKLIKLEWQKHRIKRYIKYTIVMAVAIAIILLISFHLGKSQELDEMLPNELMNVLNISQYIELFSNMAFSVLTSIMISAIIISNDEKRMIYLMFCYPIKRQKIMMAQILSVWSFNVIALFFMKVVLYVILYANTQITDTIVVADYDLYHISFYIHLFLLCIKTITIAFLGLNVGRKFRSGKVAIGVTIGVSMLIYTNIGIFSLSNSNLFQTVLMVGSLGSIIWCLLRLEKNDVKA